MSCSSQGKPYCKYEDAERQCRDLLTERKVLKELVLARQENKVAEQTPTNSQSAAALKDCIQLFASLKLALGVLKTMCRVAGLNGGMQKAVDMDLWIDEMVERLNAEAALRT
jgi:hypothetical protein